MKRSALLVTEDGTQFYGKSIGAQGITVGEVVFNTSMTGYQEILTDPSYSHQIITLTYPHIGNVGINPGDQESPLIHAAGLVIRDLPLIASNFRSEQSLDSYLKQHNIVAIADIDTRRLTRLLREKGALRGCIISGEALDNEFALQQALAFSGLAGKDLAQEVTSKSLYQWQQGSLDFQGRPCDQLSEQSLPWHIVAYDFGIKRNILRLLVDRGCRVTVVPARTPAEEVLALQPDGIFLSNGPGDPRPCTYAIAAIQTFLQQGIPLFGICLGHQLLALASGANTFKMKFGHHGGNHPVKALATGRVMITAQNHGFAVEQATLPDCLQVTHVSLFDGTLQGIEHKTQPAFGFQGHPEASPGPHDAAPLFDHFITLIQRYRNHAG
ncbi:MAG: glutamine-hydrolyzing carbamoyl-phosphate synthase small subunit [Enterobacteriaceae bacterium]